MSDVEGRLLAAIRARHGATITLSDDLAALGVDSVEMAAFIREIEDGFGIAVDEEVFDLQTVGELVRYVEQRGGR